jgi:hypothetical protein
MNVVKNKLQATCDIQEQYKVYREIASTLLDENHAELNKSLKVNINKIGSLCKTAGVAIDKLDALSVVSVEELLNVYNTSYKYYINIQNIQNTFCKRELQPVNIRSERSQSYTLGIQDHLNSNTVRYNIFLKKWKIIHIDLVQILSEKMMIKINTDLSKVIDIANELQEAFHKNRKLIIIYSKVMQDMIDAMSISNVPVMRKLLIMIEEDKTFFLINKLKITTKDKYIHVSNPPMRRFGLMPVTNLMPKNELLALILNKRTNGKISLESYAKTERVGFIILNRVVYHPVEYNIRKLIDVNESKDYIQPSEYGVSEKIVKRFDNIRTVAHSAKWNFGFKQIGDYNKVSVYCVLETLDDNTWRALAPWVSSTCFQIPKNKLKNLIDYLSNTNAPSRISSYQELVQNKSLNTMFLEKSVDVDILAEKSNNVNSQLIQNDVYMKVMSVIEKELNVKYKNCDDVNSNTDMNDIIHNVDIKNMFIHSMTNNFSNGMSETNAKEHSAGVFPFEELLASYIKELRFISMRFMKELHDGYNREPLKDSIFTTPKKEKRRTITDKLESIIKASVLITIDSKTNIYSVMTYKYNLLNYV